MQNNFGKDLSAGDVRSNLVAMWIPMLIGSLLSMGYSIINAIWVGKIMGNSAMGGVAVTMPVIMIMMALSTGATTATSILISQYCGAKEEKMIKNVVSNSCIIAGFLMLLVTGGGLLASDNLLRAMGTPEEVIGVTSGYLKIILVSFIFTSTFSLISSILRGMGDTQRPMGFVFVSTIINAILDPLLIIGVGPFPKLGLNGAGIASLIASVAASVLGYMYMRKKYPVVLLNPIKFTIDFSLIGKLFKIGFPSVLQQLLFSVSSVFITSFVNTFGVAAIAAYGAVTKIDSFITLPAMAMSMALSIITGQNLGAGKNERVKEAFKWGVIISSVGTIIVTIIAVIFPKVLLSLFLNDPAVLDVGAGYLRTVGFAYILVSVTFVPNGIINGSGKTIITMVLSFVSICLIRIPLAGVLYKTDLGIKGVWIALIISYAVSTITYMTYFFRGSWMKNVVGEGNPIEVGKGV